MEQFTFVKRGYDPEEVDKYITTLEQVIKSYKDKDNAIKNSIITAQMTADNIMRTAQAQADTYKLQIGEQLAYMRDTLEQQRKHLQAFQEVYTNMLRKYIQELEQSNMNELFTKIDEMDKAVDELQSMDIVESDTRADYLGHDMTRDYTRPSLPDHGNDSRQALRDFGDGPPTREINRDYQREVSRERERDMPRQDARDHRQTHELQSETPRGREALYQEPASHTSRDVMHPVARDSMPREIPRDTRDVPQAFQREHAAPQMRDIPRDNHPGIAPHHAQDTLHTDHNRDMHQDTGWDTPQDQRMHNYNRETTRDPRESARDPRDPRAEYLTPAPVDRDTRERDPRRDTRRDAGRDMRRDAGRDVRADVRRDPSRDMMRDTGMRPDSHEPIRDMGRTYLPEHDDYGDDQNLLPPVASLM